jgi:hypothetical protein
MLKQRNLSSISHHQRSHRSYSRAGEGGSGVRAYASSDCSMSSRLDSSVDVDVRVEGEDDDDVECGWCGVDGAGRHAPSESPSVSSRMGGVMLGHRSWAELTDRAAPTSLASTIALSRGSSSKSAMLGGDGRCTPSFRTRPSNVRLHFTCARV